MSLGLCSSCTNVNIEIMYFLQYWCNYNHSISCQHPQDIARPLKWQRIKGNRFPFIRLNISHTYKYNLFIFTEHIQSMQFIANLAKKTIQSLWAFTKFDVAEWLYNLLHNICMDKIDTIYKSLGWLPHNLLDTSYKKCHRNNNNCNNSNTT